MASFSNKDLDHVMELAETISESLRSIAASLEEMNHRGEDLATGKQKITVTTEKSWKD